MSRSLNSFIVLIPVVLNSSWRNQRGVRMHGGLRVEAWRNSTNSPEGIQQYVRMMIYFVLLSCVRSCENNSWILVKTINDDVVCIDIVRWWRC